MEPTFTDIPYGPHERNVIDVYKARSDKPTPVFLWFHGGAFAFGDKSTYESECVGPLFDHGISLVTANYRFSHQAIYPAPYHDCRRALQFTRHHAPSWGLDSRRVAVGGCSAGAGMSLWLAFRADMANPSSNDPVEHQTTRPACVYIVDGQTSYDPRFILEVIGGHAHVAGGLADLFGVPSETWPDLDEQTVQLVEDASAINFLGNTAPPVLAVYSLSRRPATDGDDAIAMIHHPKFGDDLKERMDALSLECTVIVDEELQSKTETVHQKAIERLQEDVRRVLRRHLKGAP